jgi:archaellum biogenesis ATPase FlaH
MAVVGAAGVNGFKPADDIHFANLRRIFVMFDPDEAGRRAAIAIKERLGTRCRVVELPEGLPKCDVSEFLLPVPADTTGEWHKRHPHAGHTWRDVLALLGNAAGKRVFSLAEAGVAFRGRGVGGIKLGYAGLDASLSPGLLPGQVMVVLSRTGTGKTQILCNWAHALRRRRVLFVSLEQTREEIYERLRKIASFHLPGCSDEQFELAFPQLQICDENRLSDSDFGAIVDEYETEVGARPEIVLVDYLGYFARGQHGQAPYEKVSSAIMQLKALAKEHDPRKRFVLITPHQVNRNAKPGQPVDMDDARESGVVSETADFVLGLYRPDDALAVAGQTPSGRLRLEVLKNRHGPVGQAINLVSDLLTLAVVDAGSEEANKAGTHNSWANQGWTWEDLRLRQVAEQVKQPVLR